MLIWIFISGCNQTNNSKTEIKEKIIETLIDKEMIEEKIEEKKIEENKVKEVKTKYDEKIIISKIRENYAEINNNINTYKKNEKNILGESSEWATATYYKKNNINRKIITTYYWETSKSIFELYFNKDGRLDFVFEQSYTYNRPIYQDEELAKELDDEAFDINKSIITENRYYFYENSLIKRIDNDKNIINTTEEKSKQKQMYFIKYSQELINNL